MGGKEGQNENEKKRKSEKETRKVVWRKCRKIAKKQKVRRRWRSGTGSPPPERKNALVHADKVTSWSYYYRDCCLFITFFKTEMFRYSGSRCTENQHRLVKSQAVRVSEREKVWWEKLSLKKIGKILHSCVVNLFWSIRSGFASFRMCNHKCVYNSECVCVCKQIGSRRSQPRLAGLWTAIVSYNEAFITGGWHWDSAINNGGRRR